MLFKVIIPGHILITCFVTSVVSIVQGFVFSVLRPAKYGEDWCHSRVLCQQLVCKNPDQIK